MSDCERVRSGLSNMPEGFRVDVREYDPNTMTVEAGDCLGLVCSLCGDCVLGGDEVVTMTMAELDTTCQRHWRGVHDHPNVTPM